MEKKAFVEPLDAIEHQAVAAAQNRLRRQEDVPALLANDGFQLTAMRGPTSFQAVRYTPCGAPLPTGSQARRWIPRLPLFRGGAPL